jgi:hypothetical protein
MEGVRDRNPGGRLGGIYPAELAKRIEEIGLLFTKKP